MKKKAATYEDKDMEVIYRKRDPYNHEKNDIGVSHTFPNNTSDTVNESNPGLFKFLDPKAITPSTGSPADLNSMPMEGKPDSGEDFNLTFTYDKEKNILSGNISWSGEEGIGDEDLDKILSMLQLALAGKLHALRQLELDDLTNIDFDTRVAHFIIHNASPAVNPMDPAIEIKSEFVPSENMLSKIQKTNKGFKRENIVVHLEKLDGSTVTGTVEVFFGKKQVFKFTVDKDMVNNRPIFRSQDVDKSMLSGILKGHNDIAEYIKERVNEEAWKAITQKKLPAKPTQKEKESTDPIEERMVAVFNKVDKKKFIPYDYHGTQYSSVSIPLSEAEKLFDAETWKVIKSKKSGMPMGEYIYKLTDKDLLIIR